MALLSQLSSNVVFYEGVDVYPLTPLDHTAATFPMWGVDEHFYTGVARMLNVDKRFIYYPASFGDLPLSDASFMWYLFATCDICKEYMVNCHWEVTLPHSGIRCLVRKKYYLSCPWVCESDVNYIHWLSEVGRIDAHRDEIFEHINCKSFAEIKGNYNYSSTYNLCKKCETKFVTPLEKSEAENNMSRFRMLKLILDRANVDIAILPTPSKCPLVTMRGWEIKAFIKEELENRRSSIECPRVKRVALTWLENEKLQEASCMDQSCELQTNQDEDTRSPLQEDLQKASESEDESDEMFE